MKKIILYFTFSIGLFTCPASYVGYIGKSFLGTINFDGISRTSNNTTKEVPSKIYASYYGEKDETREVKEADYGTFQISGVDIDYASDKNHVYYKGKILENVDSSTHEIIPTETYLGMKSDGFIIDKNGIYYYGKKLKGANPKNYKKNGYYITSNNIIFAKDKKMDYDVDTFEVIINGQSYSRCNDLIDYSDTIVKDKNGVYADDIKTGDPDAKTKYWYLKKINLDQNTFKYSGGFLFEDKNNYYTNNGELSSLGNVILSKKESVVYSRLDLNENRISPFMIINNDKLYQLLYSFNSNFITNNELNIKNMELYATHYDIVLLKFGDDLYTLTGEFLTKTSKIKNIFFPNKRAVVLKTKDSVITYASSLPKIYTSKTGVDISTFIYVEPGDEFKISKEKFDTGVFIDKNYIYNSDLSEKKSISRKEYRELKKYKKDFEKERLESLKAVTITTFND